MAARAATGKIRSAHPRHRHTVEAIKRMRASVRTSSLVPASLSSHSPCLFSVTPDSSMGIEVSKVAAGRCYETSMKRLRRLVKVEDGHVWWDSRAPFGWEWLPGHPKTAPTPIERFAAGVEREIP